MNQTPNRVVIFTSLCLNRGIAIRHKKNHHTGWLQNLQRDIPNDVWVRQVFNNMSAEEYIDARRTRVCSRYNIAVQISACVFGTRCRYLVRVDAEAGPCELPTS